MRPYDTSVSPVASISILASVDAPQPPDAFRPSYAQGSTKIYFSRHLRRHLLPTLSPVKNVPHFPNSRIPEAPMVDSVFFSFDVPSEYMAVMDERTPTSCPFAVFCSAWIFPRNKKNLFWSTSLSTESIYSASSRAVIPAGKPMAGTEAAENSDCFQRGDVE